MESGLRFFFVAFTVGLGTLAWTWGRHAGPAPQDLAWMPPDPEARRDLERRAGDTAESVAAEVAGLFGGISPGSLRIVLLRVFLLAHATVVFGLSVSAAILAGLVVRESSRTTLRFSSPTWNYLGKRSAGAALVAFVIVPLLPLAVPPWLPYALFLLFDMGVATYVANLPIKL